MVFHKKLPGSPPRARRSAQQLARELGMDLGLVMESLQSIGEYVDSPRKQVIEEPVVKKVYGYFGREYSPELGRAVSAWQTRDHSTPSTTRPPTGLRHLIQSNEQTSFRPKDESLGLGDVRWDAADAWADEEWKVYGFTLEECDSWRDAGLRRGQAKEAARLRDAGLSPKDLAETVAGWSVAKRLRDGETPAQVVRLLKLARAEGEAI